MALRYGPSSINSGAPKQSRSTAQKGIRSVRVRDIVLSPDHPRFEEVGGWIGLGTIFFEDAGNPGLNSPSKTTQQARPYFSNSKFYPLINEIVSIIQSPDPINSQNTGDFGRTISYYFPPANSWNSAHHNAIVSPLGDSLNPSAEDLKSLGQVLDGIPNRPKEQQSPAFLGNQFKERNNIYPLFSYEGDYILEGRWGNSIRLGSTVNNGWIKNQWSSEGENGDPILIIRNGQNPNTSQEGWVSTIEDIGEDESSIYLTSTQKVSFFPSSFRTDSFGPDDTSITPPSEYQGNHIILNSGKLTLNAKSEGVLISSPKVIHLSSGDGIHLDTQNQLVLSANEVYIADRSASERVVLGDKLVDELRALTSALSSLAFACEIAAVKREPIIALNLTGTGLKEACNDFQKALEGNNPKILSNRVKVI